MSVLDQDYHDVEYIVWTRAVQTVVDIIDRYRSRLTHVLFETDAGPADGLNKGFKLGTGDIYGFINSDDYLLPGTISHIVDFFERHPNIDVVSGHGYYVDEHERDFKGCLFS
ncbi:MAG: glycosyltransferase [Anaerolineales bacterium]|nr:glycosyltransferase [Anaerolineales bacterium]